jgi:thiol-disulfide isomerase/thioredoxin
MEKKSLLIISSTIALFFALVYFVSLIVKPTSVSLSLNDKLIYYFFGSTCTHCQELDQFIKQKKIDDKLSLTKLEVFENPENAQLMTRAAEKCKLDLNNPSSLGVPFVYYQNQCYIGTPAAEKFLEKQVKNKQ